MIIRACHANETFTSLMDGLHRVKLNVIISSKKIRSGPLRTEAVKGDNQLIFTVIGTGNMGQALVSGFLGQGILKPIELRVCDSDLNKAKNFADKNGCAPFGEASKAVIDSDYVLLSVKPQVIDSVLDGILPFLDSKTVVISIAASVTLDRLRRHLAGNTPIIRVMPNTPALAGAAVSAVCSDQVDAERLAFVIELLGSCGIVVPCSEAQLDAIGCVSGTGPAYVMLFLEAMADAAVKLGIPRDTALRISAQTIYGSGKLAIETGLHPAVLKDQVCSPGGTTIEGVLALEKFGLRAAVEAAVEAADEKTKRLAGG